MSKLVLAPVVAFCVTVPASSMVLEVLRRRRVLDEPGHRSSHAVPTPRGGGLAPALGATVAVLVSQELRAPAGIAVLVGGWSFGAIGLVDDLRSVPALVRLAVQPLPAALTAWLLVEHASVSPALGALFVFWAVFYVNAFNFMDGINGIAVAQVVVAGTTWYLLGTTEELATARAASGVIALAALGFAPYNFPTARMFLGDIGSYFLGAWLSVAALLAWTGGLPFEAVLAPLAIPMADVGVTLVRRARRGERWYEAHRDHTYQSLTKLGWSHARTTLVVTAMMSACAVLGAASTGTAMELRVLADLGIVLLAALYLCGPLLVTRLSPEPCDVKSSRR